MSESIDNRSKELRLESVTSVADHTRPEVLSVQDKERAIRIFGIIFQNLNSGNAQGAKDTLQGLARMLGIRADQFSNPNQEHVISSLHDISRNFRYLRSENSVIEGVTLDRISSDLDSIKDAARNPKTKRTSIILSLENLKAELSSQDREYRTASKSETENRIALLKKIQDLIDQLSVSTSEHLEDTTYLEKNFSESFLVEIEDIRNKLSILMNVLPSDISEEMYSFRNRYIELINTLSDIKDSIVKRNSLPKLITLDNLRLNLLRLKNDIQMNRPNHAEKLSILIVEVEKLIKEASLRDMHDLSDELESRRIER